MKKIYKIILLFLIIFIPITTKAKDKVNVYLFYSETCPHCHSADKVINELINTRNDINYYKYETTKEINAYNRNMLHQVAEIFNIKQISFPLVVIGNEYIIGYSSDVKDKYINLIDYYKEIDYKDEVGMLLGLVDDNRNEIVKIEKSYTISLPLIGEVNLKNLSLPIIAILIGFTDGFNPCAMWVLIFLITLLLNIKDRKKMWILGLTFILTSGFIYFLFMMAWLRVTDYINKITLLRNLVSIFAIAFGGYNIYNYFKNLKNDGCTIIKKEKRRFVMSNIKKVLETKSFILAIIGIIIIACLVNLIELLCSMGLPIMFTEILSLNNLSYNKYIFYIGLYILFFMLDDIIIFVISMSTLKQTAISTKYNKYSHLIGGIIMILIGILMFFKPEWLSFNFN